MESNSQFRLAGWCGYISAGATIFGFVTFVIFFVVGDPFGIINDIASVIIALSSIPILLALYEHFRGDNFAWSMTALVIGVVSLLVAAVTQTMLVLKIIKYEQTVPATIGFGMFGISLMIFGFLSYRSNLFHVESQLGKSLLGWDIFL